MKTKAQILNSEPVFVGDWAGQSQWDVLREFEYDYEIPEAKVKAIYKGVKILFAGYYGGYEGEAFVLFAKGGKLYEVYGSHCSCYGLENQWEPEVCVLKEIIKRIDTDYHFSSFRGDLKKLLGINVSEKQT